MFLGLSNLGLLKKLREGFEKIYEYGKTSYSELIKNPTEYIVKRPYVLAVLAIIGLIRFAISVAALFVTTLLVKEAISLAFVGHAFSALMTAIPAYVSLRASGYPYRLLSSVVNECIIRPVSYIAKQLTMPILDYFLVEYGIVELVQEVSYENDVLKSLPGRPMGKVFHVSKIPTSEDKDHSTSLGSAMSVNVVDEKDASGASFSWGPFKVSVNGWLQWNYPHSLYYLKDYTLSVVNSFLYLSGIEERARSVAKDVAYDAEQKYNRHLLKALMKDTQSLVMLVERNNLLDAKSSHEVMQKALNLSIAEVAGVPGNTKKITSNIAPVSTPRSLSGAAHLESLARKNANKSNDSILVDDSNTLDMIRFMKNIRREAIEKDLKDVSLEAWENGFDPEQLINDVQNIKRGATAVKDVTPEVLTIPLGMSPVEKIVLNYLPSRFSSWYIGDVESRNANAMQYYYKISQAKERLESASAKYSTKLRN